MLIDSLRAAEQGPHLPMPIMANGSHLEPQPAPKPLCPDCGGAMERCPRCANAEAGVPLQGLCPCGEEPGIHYVNGVWWGQDCYGELANEKAIHDMFTRGPE